MGIWTSRLLESVSTSMIWLQRAGGSQWGERKARGETCPCCASNLCQGPGLLGWLWHKCSQTGRGGVVCVCVCVCVCVWGVVVVVSHTRRARQVFSLTSPQSPRWRPTAADDMFWQVAGMCDKHVTCMRTFVDTLARAHTHTHTHTHTLVIISRAGHRYHIHFLIRGCPVHRDRLN